MSADLRELWSSAGGNVPDHWEFKTIEELLEHSKSISVGVMYPGSNSEGGIPLIKVSDVKNGAIASQPEFCVSKAVDEEYKRTRLNGTELLITLVGNPGDCVVATNEMAGWNAARALAVLRLKNIELRAWLRYVLLSKPAKHLIEARLNTTVQKTLNLKDIRELGVPIPPKKERESITDVIDAIETKMLLNRQTNQTLEQIAQAIFKSWFVDFEPVKAKMAALEAGGSEDDALLAAMQAIAGNALFASNAADADAATQLAHLQAEHPEQYATLRATAELFPSTMQESELGKIPEGWGTGSFKDLCLTVESGGTPKRNTPEYWGGKIKWLASGEVRDVVVLDTKETITESGLKNSPAKLWPMYTTVVAMYGATAGQVCLIADQMTSNQACCGLIPKKNYKAFTFFSAKRSIQSLSDKASGSAQQNLNKGLVEGHQTILPAETILVVYEDLVFPLMLKWIENIRESVMLAEARDTLLPKLLSGELSVSAAADQITQAEEAVNVQG